VLLWRVASGRLTQIFAHNEKHATAVAFSPSGRLVVGGSTDALARIWTIDGDLVGVSTAQTNALTDVAFSPDSDLIVTASRDGTARVSKADGGALLVSLTGHQDWVRTASFAGGDSGLAVTASTDGTARVWDATFQPQLRELADVGRAVADIAVVGRRVRARTVDGRVHVLDLRRGTGLRVVPGGRRPLQAVSRGGATATISGKTVVVEDHGRVVVLRGHRDRVLSVAFSPDGSLLATASKDHDARIWDAATGESLFRLAHSSKVRDVAFSPDGRWVVTASGRAAIWDTRDGGLVTRLQGHDGPVGAAAFDPTGRFVVTGGDDHTVRSYRCEICGGLAELMTLARTRLAITGRQLTSREHARYLG
jgi:WD40 repeat protein